MIYFKIFVFLLFFKSVIPKKFSYGRNLQQVYNVSTCARRCYLMFVSHVAPVHIDGLVSMHIHLPRRKQHKREYLNDMEAFQNVCWIYRSHTRHCLNRCADGKLKFWLSKTFFDSLENYCINHYEDIIYNWHCLQKMKKYRLLCDRECSGTCDKSCLYFCHHPVAARICKSPDPIGFLYNVSGVSSPQTRRAQRNQLCHREVTNYNRIFTRVY